MTVFTTIGSWFKSEATAAENFFAPLIAEFLPMAEADLKAAAEAGLSTAIATAACGPATMSVSAAEAALLAGARAAMASAAASGKTLGVQAAAGLVASAGLSIPALTNVLSGAATASTPAVSK